MNLETVNIIRKRHLETKRALETEATKKAKEHEAAVEAFCDKLLGHLKSDAAYDSRGAGGEQYKHTAWCKITYATNDWGCIEPDTTYIALPGNSYAEKLECNYYDEDFKSVLYDVVEEFEKLDGFEVNDDRYGTQIVMRLEDTH